MRLVFLFSNVDSNRGELEIQNLQYTKALQAENIFHYHITSVGICSMSFNSFFFLLFIDYDFFSQIYTNAKEYIGLTYSKNKLFGIEAKRFRYVIPSIFTSIINLNHMVIMKNIVRFLLLCVVASSTCTACRNQEMSDLESGAVKQSPPPHSSTLLPPDAGVKEVPITKLKDDSPVKGKDGTVGAFVDVFYENGFSPDIKGYDLSDYVVGPQPYDPNAMGEYALEEVIKIKGVPRLHDAELRYQPDHTYADPYTPGSTLMYSDLPKIEKFEVDFESDALSSNAVNNNSDHKKLKQDSRVKKSKVRKN